jgi:hypothetical protein
MTEEKKGDHVTDPGDDARDRKLEVSEHQVEPAPAQPDEDATGRRILRGCGIALAIAGALFFLVFGACFIALAQW